MKTPSIALLPSAYKTSKVYTVLPTDSGDGDFTFSRGSSATRINSSGVIETVSTNVPRLNYNASDLTECPHLLLEPQRENLALYSEDLSNAVWDKTRSSVSNSYSSPDGTNTAYKLIEDTSVSTSHILRQIIPKAASSIEYTCSVFVKAEERSEIRFDLTNLTQTGYFGCFFDLENGTTGSAINVGSFVFSNSKIEYYGNGWYRCSITGTSDTSTSVKPLIWLSDDNEDVTYTGDGTSGLYVWGFQLEDSEYHTSYIKTVASTVARSADVCNSSGTSTLINSEEGVLYCEIAALFNNLSTREISLSDGTNSNVVSLGYNTTTQQITGYVKTSGVSQANLTHTIADITDFTKIVLKYKLNDFALWINGVEVATDVSGTAPTGLLDCNFDDGSGASDFYGKVRDLRIYTEALTDAELTTLTT